MDAHFLHDAGAMNLDGLLNSASNGGRASAIGGSAVDPEDDFGKLAAGVRSEDGSLNASSAGFARWATSGSRWTA